MSQLLQVITELGVFAGILITDTVLLPLFANIMFLLG